MRIPKPAAAIAALMAIAVVGAAAGPANAEFGIDEGSLIADAFKDDGSPETQAGAHPHHATAAFNFNTVVEGSGSFADENVKDVVASLPLGFMGDPTATPRCERAAFAASISTNVPCPPETQVGTISLVLSQGFLGQWGARTTGPVFSLVPRRGDIADFAFMIAGVPTHAIPRLREDGSYGLDVEVRNISSMAAVRDQELTLWGVPADSSHDDQRVCTTNATLVGCETRSVPGPRKPFLTLPTRCEGRDRSDFALRSWQDPTDVKRYSALTQSPVTGCADVPFQPSIAVTPSSSAVGSATGLDVDLAFPQDGDPDGLATAHLKDTTVTLPAGLTVNPSVAAGLTGCSDEQMGVTAWGSPPAFDGEDPVDGRGAECPAGSVIGSVTARTPVLDEEITGDVVLGAPKSTDPQSGEMLRMFLVLRVKERGILVKLYGSAKADPITGRLTATFENNPQVPVESLKVRLKGGDRGVLGQSQSCGDRTTAALLTPWTVVGTGGGVAKTASSTFAVGGDCSVPFAPRLSAGMSTQQPRGSGAFSFRFSRGDSEPWLSGLTAKLPRGLLASIKDVPRCPQAQAAAGACPAESRIGSVDAAAGAGTPFVLERKGDVYLTQGYKGGAYGLMVRVPVEAGPFRGDMALNPVVVRQALHVDRATAAVTAVSDPLPQIWHGIPLRLREVAVQVDRPGFMLNPSDCSAKQVRATFASGDGKSADAAQRFSVKGCAALPFKPRLGLRLVGRRQRTTGKHPAVRAVVRQSGVGEAGIRRVRVVLPGSLALDPDNAQALCEFADGTKPDLEAHCPVGSRVGRARAKTPLLDRDLVGDVYFVKNVRRDKRTGNLIRTLPMLVVALRGEIAINLVGKSSTTRNGRLVNTFAGVPDAPITRFNLNIKGGTNGILAVTGNRNGNINLCTRPNSHLANTGWRGHNGKRADYRIRVKTPCGKARNTNANRKTANRKAAAKKRAAANRKAAADNGRAAAKRRT